MEKKNKEKEVLNAKKVTCDEEVYDIACYEEENGYRLYFRKFGEKRGTNIYYEDEFDLVDYLVDALIDNKKLRLKQRDAKRALR